MTNLYDIIRKPVITESTTRDEEKYRKYTFEVHIRAQKKDIKLAAEKIFAVEVERVNILIRKGKVRKVKNKEGKTKDIKKAIITLRKESSSIDITGRLN